MSVTQQQVVSLLENVLFESATQANANAASWQADPAAGSIASLAAAMAASAEGGIAQQIVGYYLASLGRAPTASEIRFYVSFAEKGLTSAQIAAGQVPAAVWSTISGFFVNSPEFAGRAGLDTSLGPTGAMLEAIPWLYQSVLGRAPSTSEIAFYDSLAMSGTSLTSLFDFFAGSQEFATDTASQIHAALADYGAAVAAGQQPPATIGATVTLGPPAPAAPTPPSAVYFTTSTDSFTATWTSVRYLATLGGSSPTLTANDRLDGIGTGNTLEISDTSGATSHDLMPSGVTLTRVPTITLTTSGNAGADAAHPFDLSGFASVTSVTVTASGTQGDYIKLASGMALNLQTASSTVGIMGFGSLALTGNSLTTLDLSGTAGTITITDPSGPTALTINASALTLAGNIADASNHITSLTIDGGSGAASTVDFSAHVGGYSIVDSALTSLTVTGNVTFGAPLQGVNLPSSLTNFDSSGATGSIYLSYSGSGATFNFGNSSVYLVDQSGNTLTGTGANAEIFTGGAGTGEIITFTGGGSTISLGDGGHDTVTLGNTSSSVTFGTTSGHNTVTLGNGNNTVTDNSSVGANHITVGTGVNSIDLGHLTNDIVTVGPDAAYGSAPTTPNLVVTHIGLGAELVLSNITSLQGAIIPGTLGQGGSVAGTISRLESDLASHPLGVGGMAFDVYNGDTYIVATASGGSSLSATDTTVIRIVGYATANLNWSGSDNIIHLT